jgi:LL-diaminopimelate aminotransferase
MLLNYPNNPTGALASPRFFANVVEFARTYDIAVCHDNPYSEILFDGAQRLSFLSIPGARDVGIELNSLSKPYNMTGWRIGMALGNKTLVAGLSKVKENTDSGIFAPVQYAAVKALQTEDANVAKMLGIYARRRALVVETFRSLGWQYDPPKGTFYLWIPTRAGARSDDFAAMLLEEASVVVAPGAGYGQYGEGYIRISVTVPDDRLHEAMDRIKRALS